MKNFLNSENVKIGGFDIVSVLFGNTGLFTYETGR